VSGLLVESSAALETVGEKVAVGFSVESSVAAAEGDGLTGRGSLSRDIEGVFVGLGVESSSVSSRRDDLDLARDFSIHNIRNSKRTILDVTMCGYFK
jgi:hypothetical protein